jgi:hypothetical protein
MPILGESFHVDRLPTEQSGGTFAGMATSAPEFSKQYQCPFGPVDYLMGMNGSGNGHREIDEITSRISARRLGAPNHFGIERVPGDE